MKLRSLFFTFLLLLFVCSRSVNGQYRNPVTPINPVNGIEYYYFESTLTTEPAGLDTLSNFLLSGYQPGFSLTKRLRPLNYTFNFQGYIKVPVDTVYTFFTSSDDGSNLYIDTTKVVANDGDHGETERSGVIRLKAGYHRIRVYFHQSAGDAVLSVRYSSDLIVKTAIPDSVLFRDGLLFPEISGLRDTTMFEEDSLNLPLKARIPGSPPSSLLQLTGNSSNSSSISPSDLVFSGTDSMRTLKVKSRPGVIGNVLVFVRLRATGSKTSIQAFRIHVRTRVPSLSSLSDTFLVMNTGITNRRITLSDPDNDVAALTLTAISGNTSVISNTGIQITGSGANRFISVTPQANATGSALITFKVTDPSNRSEEKSFLVSVGDTNTFRAPDVSTNPVNGLDFLFARAPGGNVLNFTNILPDQAGRIRNFLLTPAGNNDDAFGMEFQGFVKIHRTAAYTFFTNSDDGSMLFIGDSPVVSNDGAHALEERSGIINLKAGLHKITVKYKEATGNQTLEVRYAGGGLSKRVIPDSILFRNGFTHPSIAASSDTVYAYKTWFATIPFSVTDPDGDVAAATARFSSSAVNIVPLDSMAIGGSGANRSLDFIPSGVGVLRLKVVITDAQGLMAIQTFQVRVRDTNVVASTVPVLKSPERTVVPNPVKGRFQIEGMNPSEPILVTDVQGRKLFSGPVSEADLSGFQPGVYFILVLKEAKMVKVLKE